MFNQKHRMKAVAPGLNVLAVLALLATSWFGAVSPMSAQGGSADVAIFTTENGAPAYDACYVLVGYSNVGCDENWDGRVMFAAIPYGTYTVRQTANLGAGRYVNDFTIQVRGNINSAGYESFAAVIYSTGSTSSTSVGQASDVAIVTTEHGQPVYDACFVLVGYSNVGCDENRDGKITFEDIPLGDYTVRQTANLGSGRYVNDFTIRVTGSASSDGWERFHATVNSNTGGSSTPSGSVDIALITRDPNNGSLLRDTCYVLVGYSNEGCDENGDGQVTFADIPFGTYTVRQTRTPAGYPTINDYEINVQPMAVEGGGEPIAVPLGFIVKQAPQQNAPSTRNVSVILVNGRTFEKVVSGACVELVGASNVGCDEDLLDGQIDFVDVPAGGPYELRFTNVRAGYEVVALYGPLSYSINAEPGSPANEIIYVLLSGTGAGGTGTSSTSAASSDTRPMQISAMACTTADPAAIQAGRSAHDGTCYWDIGAAFTVTTESGQHLGSCTLAGDRNAEIRIVGSANCKVSIPVGVPVVVTQDVSTITPGTVPQENPLYYTWPTDPVAVASYMGVGFVNLPTGN